MHTLAKAVTKLPWAGGISSVWIPLVGATPHTDPPVQRGRQEKSGHPPLSLHHSRKLWRQLIFVHLQILAQVSPTGSLWDFFLLKQRLLLFTGITACAGDQEVTGRQGSPFGTAHTQHGAQVALQGVVLIG